MYGRLRVLNGTHEWESLLGEWNASLQSPIPHRYTIGLGVYLLVIGGLSFLLNALVVLTFMCRWRSEKTAVEWCLINLAVTGIVPALMSYPIYAMSCFNGGWFLGHSACLFDAVVVFFFGMVSISTLVLIALLRLLNTLRSSQALPSTRVLLLFTYVFAAFWSLAPVLGWGRYDVEPSKLTCGLTWYDLSPSYFATLVLAGYFLPLCVISYCYLKIWLSIRKMRTDRFFASACTKKRVSLTKVTFYTCVAFFITWTPYTFFSMTSYAKHELELASPLVSTIPGMLAKSSWIFNPLIYFFMVRRFRQATVATLCCRELPTLESKSLLQMTPKRTRSSHEAPGKRRPVRAHALVSVSTANEATNGSSESVHALVRALESHAAPRLPADQAQAQLL